MTNIVERLRAYTMGDFDTYAVLRHRGEWIAQVTMIREASDLCETVHEAAAEIERLRAAQAWQPIETAPRDGTPVLLLVARAHGAAVIVEAEMVHGVWEYGPNGDRVDLPPQWVAPYEVWGGNTVTDDATHWRPLPEPPA